MALISHVIAHFLGATGGEVRFALNIPVANPVLGEIIEAVYIAEVDMNGQIAVDLPINGDPDLVPQGSAWRVQHKLLPAGTRRSEYDLILTMADVDQTINLASRIGV